MFQGKDLHESEKIEVGTKCNFSCDEGMQRFIDVYVVVISR